MKERFPILMWAEMFKTSPKFSYAYGPTKVLLAIELCLRGDPSPWKHAQNSIEDEKQRLAITDGSYQTKRSKRESTPDPRTNLQPGAAAWLEVPLQQRWSASGGTWEGWISYPSLEQVQSGGKDRTRTHHQGMPCPAFQKNRVIVHGVPPVTNSPGHLLRHHGDHRTWKMHHGAKDKGLLCRGRRKSLKAQMRKAGGQED